MNSTFEASLDHSCTQQRWSVVKRVIFKSGTSMKDGTPRRYDAAVCKNPRNTESGVGITAGNVGSKVAIINPVAGCMMQLQWRLIGVTNTLTTHAMKFKPKAWKTATPWQPNTSPQKSCSPKSTYYLQSKLSMKILKYYVG